MKNVFFKAFLILTCLYSGIAKAQPAQVTLTGIIDLNTGESFPFKLVVTEQDGKIKGYSYTYKEPNDAKTAIKGFVDKQHHILSFKETEIIYSHGVQTKAYMCLVDANLNYIPGGKGNILIGTITSTESDKTSCTGGSIMFTNEDEIKNLFSYHEKFDTVISMKKKTKDPYTPPAEPKPTPVAETPLVTDKVTAGTEKAYEWHSDTVIIDLWDGGNTDGDRVTINFNGKPVLFNYYLVKERKQLRIPLAAQAVNTIAIIADNEGSDPPNTATLKLTDGTKQYSVVAYNTKGMQAILKIRKVK